MSQAQSYTATLREDQHPYLYVLVRQDISPEQQLVQASHAAFEAGLRFYGADSPTSSLIALTVPHQKALLRAQRKLTALGIRTFTFFEPDFGMGESALATEPLMGAQRAPLRGYPLLTFRGIATPGHTTRERS